MTGTLAGSERLRPGSDRHSDGGYLAQGQLAVTVPQAQLYPTGDRPQYPLGYVWRMLRGVRNTHSNTHWQPSESIMMLPTGKGNTDWQPSAARLT